MTRFAVGDFLEMLRSWEDPSRLAPTAKRPWEEGCELDSDEESEDSSDNEETNSKQAAFTLLDMLISLYMKGTLSAKCFCVICYWCFLAGIGEMEKYSKAPGKQTGAYQQKLDTALGFKSYSKRLMEVSIPGHHKFDATRAMHTVSGIPVHESIDAEFQENPGMMAELQASTADGDWSPAYVNYPVVQASTEPVLPLALYTDGAPFCKNDGFVGFFVINLVTSVRHLCLLLRKSNLCACGCRGWCSILCALEFLQWGFTALANNVCPTQRSDRQPWKITDSFRQTRAGKALSVVAALVNQKCDWAEFCLTFGFPTWSHKLRPCLFCSATLKQLYDTVGLTLESFPFQENSDADYDAACSACEIWTEIPDEATHKHILAHLQYSKKPTRKGRCLTRALPDLRPPLNEGDRLEPSGSLQDIGLGFDMLVSFPAIVLFWRVCLETIATHRNPLAKVPGYGYITYAIDILHTIFLGVAQNFCKWVMWRCITKNVWAIVSDGADRMQLSVLRLRTELWQYYDADPENRSENRLQQLTVKMMGTQKHKKLKTKAAETKHLLPFIAHLIDAHKRALGVSVARNMASAVAELQRFIRVMDTNPRALSQEAAQDLKTNSTVPSGIVINDNVHQSRLQ